MNPIPKNPVVSCSNCGQPWMTMDTHHCPCCGVHLSCDACVPYGKARLCRDARWPHIGIVDVGRQRVPFIIPPIPTANQIRWTLGLSKLEDGGDYGPMETQAADQGHERDGQGYARAAQAAQDNPAASSGYPVPAEALSQQVMPL